VDYIGISLIVVGVGLLQYVLDKGQEIDWFASKMILVSSIVAIVALVALVIRELKHENPIMDLRLLGKRNFATAVTFSFILGMVLNGSTILLPQFLQSDLGYNRTAGRHGAFTGRDRARAHDAHCRHPGRQI
jgi:MFS transporter, DHA2 family, multidrug resistance protein